LGSSSGTPADAGGTVAYDRGMVGRVYLERGRPVAVVARWGSGGGPRNVLIRRASGELVVRPFRGLRKQR
jgi:acetyl esterase